jgi:hypothetical protein
MEPPLRENGSWAELSVKAASLTQRGKCTKEAGVTIKLMDLVFIPTQIKPDMKESGSKICNTEEALSRGLIPQSSLANILRVAKMA